MGSNILSPFELKELIKHRKNEIIITDIREVHEFNDWNIADSINIPVNSLLVQGDYRGMKKELCKLPKDKFIITVCMRGINSQVISSVLNEMGYMSASLEKGMKGWNENFDVYEINFPDFVIVQFVRVGKGCLSYIIISKKSTNAVLIEPSIFTSEYINYIDAHKLTLTKILDTHAHADHFSGGMALSKETGIDYYINSADVDGDFRFKSLLGMHEIKLDEVVINIIPTPGHTDGSLSFLIDNKALVCGDLMLLESPGRPDLARTKEDTIKGAGILFDTLHNIIFKLEESVKIFPSHFTKTELRPVVLSLGELKNQCKPLQMTQKEEFIEYLTSNIPLTPPNYESIKKFNKAGAIIPMDYAEDLEIGPNRCAAR